VSGRRTDRELSGHINGFLRPVCFGRSLIIVVAYGVACKSVLAFIFLEATLGVGDTTHVGGCGTGNGAVVALLEAHRKTRTLIDYFDIA